MMLKKQFSKNVEQDHIENYINFTTLLVQINPDYPYENDLEDTVSISVN
jgi:hypothetical protein